MCSASRAWLALISWFVGGAILDRGDRRRGMEVSLCRVVQETDSRVLGAIITWQNIGSYRRRSLFHPCNSSGGFCDVKIHGVKHGTSYIALTHDWILHEKPAMPISYRSTGKCLLSSCRCRGGVPHAACSDPCQVGYNWRGRRVTGNRVHSHPGFMTLQTRQQDL